ncbi:MAG: HAD family hydrolase [Alphaproteobacteria bacterium]
MPRAVLLDWDDTLVDNWASIHAAMNATLAAMGLAPWSLEQTRRQAKQSLRDSFPGIFGARWEEARDVFYRNFAAGHLAGLRPLPGADELLAALFEADFFLGVVSNKTGAYLRREAAHLGWDRYFGALVGATDAPEDKPKPAPVMLALRPSGISPGPEVWFVGDGPVDVDCARRSGCLAVLVRPEPPSAEEFGALMPDRHVATLVELRRLLHRT